MRGDRLPGIIRGVEKASRRRHNPFTDARDWRHQRGTSISRSYPPNGHTVNVAEPTLMTQSGPTHRLKLSAPLAHSDWFTFSPATMRANPTFCSDTAQTPDSRPVILLCGWYRPLFHCHQDRPTRCNSDHTISLEQFHLPTLHFLLASSYTAPDRS